MAAVKVYYVECKVVKEIRKFIVDSELAEDFEYLVGRIRSVFPDLLKKDLELFWKDDEDDYISISSNEELIQAIHGVPTDATCLKVFVKAKKEKPEDEPVEHTGVICDDCDTNIFGIRYKCSDCSDFDLCTSCESKGLHPLDHEMICSKKPRKSVPVYVIRPSIGKSCHRGRVPFSGIPWGYSIPFGLRGGYCSRKQEASARKSSEKNEESDQHNQYLPEMFRQLAARIWCDSDVTENHIKVFFGDLSKKFQEKNTQEEQKEQNEENTEKSRVMAQKMNEEVDTDATTEQNMETETKSETGGSNNIHENNHSSEIIKHMVNNVAQKVVFSPTQQNDNKPFVNLDEVVGNVFESLSSATIPEQNGNGENQTIENQVKQKEDFVVVDNNPADIEQLSEEKKYELRLQKAVRQMESMGFDNEGGWLRQLLISKDLSIGKVLDALNPVV